MVCLFDRCMFVYCRFIWGSWKTSFYSYFSSFYKVEIRFFEEFSKFFFKFIFVKFLEKKAVLSIYGGINQGFLVDKLKVIFCVFRFLE